MCENGILCIAFHTLSIEARLTSYGSMELDRHNFLYLPCADTVFLSMVPSRCVELQEFVPNVNLQKCDISTSKYETGYPESSI